MKLNLFSVPIWVGNIDSSKIILEEKQIQNSFDSEVKSSYNDECLSIQEESLNYLYQIVVNLLNQEIIGSYEVKLNNIWSNYYEESDFQENHIHAGSDISFIIYKKINESRTVFVNPAGRILDAFYSPCKIKTQLFGGVHVKPECRENQIIIFPSFLEHFVQKTNDSITIAGNMNLTFQ